MAANLKIHLQYNTDMYINDDEKRKSSLIKGNKLS